MQRVCREQCPALVEGSRAGAQREQPGGEEGTGEGREDKPLDLGEERR